MESRIATAAVRFRLDINFGDPVTPAPRTIELPLLRPDMVGHSMSVIAVQAATDQLVIDSDPPAPTRRWP